MCVAPHVVCAWFLMLCVRGSSCCGCVCVVPHVVRAWFLMVCVWFLMLCVRGSSCCGCVQEIDGKALMLLRSDMVMKYMGLKLGPALKLCHHIERLRGGKP